MDVVLNIMEESSTKTEVLVRDDVSVSISMKVIGQGMEGGLMRAAHPI